MIEIKNKIDCVGCNGCVQVCPVSCISMIKDEQGFNYPKVNQDLCIHCNKCDRVCPVINQSEPKETISVYGAFNPNKFELETSSSGGIFILLAKKIISEGGVVFGARFNENWEVIHDYAETIEGIKQFQGSKYVQSRIEDNYIKAEQFLKSGRKVLFTGTPCQIAGLNLFLKKDYGNLLIKVDVICHGVPSPLIWEKYVNILTDREIGKNTDLETSLKDMPSIEGISFRDKKISWEKYGFSVLYAATNGSGKNSDFQSLYTKEKKGKYFFEPLSKNLYLQCFLKDLSLRPSCFACPSKAGKSNSDITIADFWRCKELLPKAYNINGTSLIISHTLKGNTVIKDLNLKLYDFDPLKIIQSSRSYYRSVKKPKEYDLFWEIFIREDLKSTTFLIEKMNPSLFKRGINKIKQKLNFRK